ncbi:WW domain-binding protein 2-like [Amphibalanus amphitrite]|uniref:WW domain-binding protein 2-like n=1 Tax=Amphibalanus amphitrite TaxID=1232801 RepID=UPI001C901E47|nr:WW domain-binding protein 2-like [Amphibalanus amphitrite]
MAVNSAHAPGGGVLIHAGESIILFCKNVVVDFDDVRDCKEMHGDKKGCLYLTTHRMIFTHDKKGDKFVSFSFPFVTLQEVELEQPLFGANYIKGKVRAQPGGGFSGEARFKLTFKHGGCIEFGQAMLQAAKMAGRHTSQGFAPPPYTPYQGNVYPAPPPAYTPPQQGFYGWVPPYQTFPDQPPAGSVFVQEAPPPYPGLGGYPAPPGYPPQNGGSGLSAPAGAPPVGFYTPGAGPGPAYAPPPPQPGYWEAPPQYQKKND